MEKQEIIEQLIQLEKTSSNDFELGGLVRDFIRRNFEELRILDKHGKTSHNKIEAEL
jgi:hypothetical protein